jgi:prepilin peptidase CpaA
VVVAGAAPAWGGHLLSGGIALALGMVAFARGWVGGGDAKLLAAVALWAGTDLLLPLLVVTSAFGAVLALSLLWMRQLAWPGCLPALAPGAPIPYGVAIAAGAVWLVPHLPV